MTQIVDIVDYESTWSAMRNPSDKIRVSYADFLVLCHVEKPDDWAPGLRVGSDGVWIAECAGDHLLVPQERAHLLLHPDHDPTKPILTFPCTLGEIRTRLAVLLSNGIIDPFEMADFVISKANESSLGASELSKASVAQLERHASKRTDILRAGMAVAWHFPPDRKDAASLARQVEQKAALFWPETGEPPVQRRALTDILSDALKLPKK